MKMKKDYNTPEIQIQVLASTDVITLSSVGEKKADSLTKKSSTLIDF